MREAITVLFVGKLIGIKRPLDFVEAIVECGRPNPGSRA